MAIPGSVITELQERVERLERHARGELRETGWTVNIDSTIWQTGIYLYDCPLCDVDAAIRREFKYCPSCGAQINWIEE